jgi:hypothetical protein
LLVVNALLPPWPTLKNIPYSGADMDEPDSNRPTTPFEAASYDLKKFRERRIADRRFMPRGGTDRRIADTASPSQPTGDSGDDSMSPPWVLAHISVFQKKTSGFIRFYKNGIGPRIRFLPLEAGIKMLERTEWEIVDEEPARESTGRQRAGRIWRQSAWNWKLTALAIVGATVAFAMAVLAGTVVFVLSLIGLAVVGIAKARSALRRFGAPKSKSGDSLNRPSFGPSNY